MSKISSMNHWRQRPIMQHVSFLISQYFIFAVTAKSDKNICHKKILSQKLLGSRPRRLTYLMAPPSGSLCELQRLANFPTEFVYLNICPWMFLPDNKDSLGNICSCGQTPFLVENSRKLLFAWWIWAVDHSQRGDSGNTEAQLRKTGVVRFYRFHTYVRYFDLHK